MSPSMYMRSLTLFMADINITANKFKEKYFQSQSWKNDRKYCTILFYYMRMNQIWRERWFWQNTQRSNSPSQTSSETYKAMLNAPRPLTTGSIYKCKLFPFDSTDETLVYQDDLQLGNNFVSGGQFSTVLVLQHQKE